MTVKEGVHEELGYIGVRHPDGSVRKVPIFANEAAPDLEVFVSGLAMAKGNHRAVVNKSTGFAVISDTGGRDLKNWETRIANIFAGRRAAVSMAPWRAQLAFVMPRPVSTPKKLRRPWHTKKPDIDKLTRAVLDGIVNGQVMHSDSQVCRLEVTKFVAAEGEPAGVHIRLWELGVEALE